MEYDLLQKVIVRNAAVTQALTSNLNAVRSNLLGIASKVAPRIALLTDAKEIERLVAKELEQVLADMAEPKTLIEGVLHYEE